MALHEQLLITLENVAKDLKSNISSPNHGGCCIIASEVGLQLSRYTSCSLKVIDGFAKSDVSLSVLGDNSPTSPAAAMRYFLNNNVRFGHVVLKVRLNEKIVYWDTKGVASTLASKAADSWCVVKATKGDLSVEVGAILGKSGGWNKRFDRRQIPKIRKIVNKHFKELDSKLQKSLTS